MSLPFKQTVDGKEIDLNDLLNKTVVGADEAAQKPDSARRDPRILSRAACVVLCCFLAAH
jgi:hypothetical protein